MTLSRRLMVDGEHIVTSTRTHVKVLVVPTLVLLVAAGAGGYAAAAVREAAGDVAMWITVAVAVAIVLRWSVLPFLRWLTWTYTVTNKRIVEQRGLLSRAGRVIPLNRINDVAFHKHLNDRLLGCGTLIIHDASEQAGLRLRDIPHIDELHRTLTHLVETEGSASARHESL